MNNATSVLLDVQHVSQQYALPKPSLLAKAGHIQALNDVSFQLKAGQSLGIVGESGSGKSTLARLVMALEKPTQGKVVFKGQDLNALSADQLRAARSDFQMVFQDPYGSLDPRQKVLRIVAEPLHSTLHSGSGKSLSSQDLKDRAAQALTEVGLRASDLDKYPHEFSGGMRQRVAIARAIAQDRKVLLMDEPFSALDAITRDLLHDELIRIWQETGLAILFVTHNVREAVRLGQRVILMSSKPGKIIRQWKIEFAQPRRIDSNDVAQLASTITDHLRQEIIRHA